MAVIAVLSASYIDHSLQYSRKLIFGHALSKDIHRRYISVEISR